MAVLLVPKPLACGFRSSAERFQQSVCELPPNSRVTSQLIDKALAVSARNGCVKDGLELNSSVASLGKFVAGVSLTSTAKNAGLTAWTGANLCRPRS
jgi:hypothetical protein